MPRLFLIFTTVLIAVGCAKQGEENKKDKALPGTDLKQLSSIQELRVMDFSLELQDLQESLSRHMSYQKRSEQELQLEEETSKSELYSLELENLIADDRCAVLFTGFEEAHLLQGVFNVPEVDRVVVFSDKEEGSQDCPLESKLQITMSKVPDPNQSNAIGIRLGIDSSFEVEPKSALGQQTSVKSIKREFFGNVKAHGTVQSTRFELAGGETTTFQGSLENKVKFEMEINMVIINALRFTSTEGTIVLNLAFNDFPVVGVMKFSGKQATSSDDYKADYFINGEPADEKTFRNYFGGPMNPVLNQVLPLGLVEFRAR